MSCVSKPKPPRLARWLLHRLSEYQANYLIAGDLDEAFSRQLAHKGRYGVCLWYWRQVQSCVPGYLKSAFFWRMTMFVQYLKTARRSMQKQRLYATIHVLGLAMGIASCLAILMYVNNELSFDRFHPASDRVYRIALAGTLGGESYASARIPSPAAPILVQSFPEIETAVRLVPDNLNLFRYQDHCFNEPAFFFAEPSVFDVFSYPLVNGDPGTALAVPNSVVIDEALAQRLFGEEKALGRVIAFNDMADLTVTGVFKNPPSNSHLSFHLLISFSTLEEYWPYALQSRDWPGAYTYVRLRSGTDERQFRDKIEAFFPRQFNDMAEADGGDLKGVIQPLTAIHLHSNMPNEWMSPGQFNDVVTFGAIGLLILVMACVNYWSLTTARSGVRAKEIGLRKTLGASRPQVVMQLLGESCWLGLLALLGAAVLLLSLQSVIKGIVGPAFSLASCLRGPFVLQLMGVTLFVILVSGLLPAFSLSRFQPHESLRGITAGAKTRQKTRMTLVISQFSILMALMVMALGVLKQIQFLYHQPMGFDQKRLLSLKLVNDHSDEDNSLIRFQTLKQELTLLPTVHAATLSSHVPGTRYYEGQFSPEGENGQQSITMETYEADADFIQTFQIPLILGRAFSKSNLGEATSIMVNETAAAQWGWEDPIGKRVTYSAHDEEGTYRVIGVFKDFHSRSFHHQIKPMVLFNSSHCHYLTLNVDRENLAATLEQIRETWNRIEANHPFDYFFLEDRFHDLYQSEIRMSRIIKSFTVVAMFIGCLGLVGLISFTTERRTKEIGIRKSLGASFGSIVGLFLREFMGLMAVAILLAWPLGYQALQMWLAHFAYRMNVHAAIFVVSAAAGGLLGMLTIGYWVLRVARTNPVKSLRYE